VIRGTAVLELVGRRMIGEVYSCLLGIAIQCGIEDGLKVRRGHQWERWVADGRPRTVVTAGL
jgi:hypothetical protein